jgi:ABC-type nitrate/sulfonate/bicarbonate transport system ATPase subunit
MKAQDLTVRFGDKTVLDHLSLTWPDEGLTLLSGPSGVGKTTLLRVLAGLLTPETGTLTLSGRPVLLFQEDRLFPRRSALEQVEAVLPRERRGEAKEYLALVELSDALEKKPKELSGGMARRVALARALAVEGEVWLLDEPFAGVDMDRAKRILLRLRDLNRPILLTGHAPELAPLCDTVLSL